jgi:uncharacterized protein YjbI with pentapeptide repeats
MEAEIRSDTRYEEETFEGLTALPEEISDSVFLECRFLRCSLAETVFRTCRFPGCTFESCDLSLARIPGCDLTSARFVDSKVIGVDFTAADWHAPRIGGPIAFQRCALDHSTFLGLRLQGATFLESRAREADFREANLARADFRGTDLEGALFTATDLTEADLSAARNYAIAPGENTLRKARFSLPEALSLLHGLDIVLVPDPDDLETDPEGLR